MKTHLFKYIENFTSKKLNFFQIKISDIFQLGEERAILVLFVRVFDLCLFGFIGFLFPVWKGLRFVIVALPGLFSYLFFFIFYLALCQGNFK